MYLSDVERHEPTPEAGRYGRAIRQGRKTGAYVPGIYHLFAFRPQAGRYLSHFTHEVMRGDSPLSPALRELIAAWTSARNHCPF